MEKIHHSSESINSLLCNGSSRLKSTRHIFELGYSKVNITYLIATTSHLPWLSENSNDIFLFINAFNRAYLILCNDTLFFNFCQQFFKIFSAILPLNTFSPIYTVPFTIKITVWIYYLFQSDCHAYTYMNTHILKSLMS